MSFACMAANLAAEQQSTGPKKASVAFRPIGEAFRLATHAHLTFDINIGAWVDACDDMLGKLHGWLAPDVNTSKGNQRFRRRFEQERMALTEELALACEPLRMISEEGVVERGKRQLLAFIGGTILGIFGLGSLANIGHDDLEANQRHMVVGIKANEHRIGAIEDDMARLKSSVVYTMEELRSLDNELEMIVQLEHVKSTVGVFVKRLEVVTDVSGHLYSQKLSQKALSKEHLVKAKNEVNRLANLMGFEVAFQHVSDIFQAPTSFLLGRRHVRVFVHLAVRAIAARPMRVFQYTSAPVWVNKNVYATIEDAKDVIMVSHDQAWSQAITTSALEACQHMGMTYVCEEPQVFVRNLSSFCLGAMYGGDEGAVVEHCRVRFHRGQAEVVPVARDRFVLFHPFPTAGTISCPDREQQREVFQGLQEKQLEPGCEAVTPAHSFMNPPTIKGVDVPFHLVQVELPDKLLLRDCGDDKMDEAMKQLAKVGTHKPTDAEMRRTLDEMAAIKWEPHNIIPMAMTIGGFIVLGLVFIWLFRRFRGHFKAAGKTTPRTTTEAGKAEEEQS